MEQQKTNIPASPEKIEEASVPQAFKGYTMSQLRYRKALTAVKRDFSQASLAADIEKIKNRKLFFNGRNFADKNTWLNKALSGLNYFDYALLGFSAFSSVKRFISIFQKKKK